MKFMKQSTLFLTITTLLCITSCSEHEIPAVDILPLPSSVEQVEGSFNVRGAAIVCDEAIDAQTASYLRAFALQLGEASGRKSRFAVTRMPGAEIVEVCGMDGCHNERTGASQADVAACGLAAAHGSRAIVFAVCDGMEEDEYAIDSTGALDDKSAVVLVEASGRAGFLNAVATLKQLMPMEIYACGDSEAVRCAAGRRNALADAAMAYAAEGEAPDSLEAERGFHVARLAEETPFHKAPVAVATRIPSRTPSWKIARVRIADKPLFGYRGIHLDVSRHFFPVSEVLRYLDAASYYKLNRLHWHLTDDQGWRVEIKSHPELTEKGAYRDGTVIRKDWDSNDGVRHGGFYTQEEIRRVVAYADSLGITVIPEIDLPGHMMGVLASHPELGCTGGPYSLWQRWGVSKDVLCVGKPETMNMLFDILGEVAELFPSEYFHVGGDECPKVRWAECPCCQAKIRELGLKSDSKYSAEHKLQTWVMNSVQEFLASKGKKVIGWDEILEGGELLPGTIIMSWRGTKGGIAAAARGLKCIMSPSGFLYIDHYQSADQSTEPFAIGGCETLEKVYGYDPFDGFPSSNKGKILGVQANLWTEYIATPEHLEFMLMPRLQALSELQWCPYDTRDISRLEKSLREHQFPMLVALGYNFRALD